MAEKLVHKVFAARNAALENIVDELTGLYLSTIYKLRNLK